MTEYFRIESCVRQGCNISHGFFNVYMDAVIKGENGEGREWRLPGLLYAGDLVLCGKLEENLKQIVGCFV